MVILWFSILKVILRTIRHDRAPLIDFLWKNELTNYDEDDMQICVYCCCIHLHMCPFPPSYVYEGPNNCVLDRIYQNSLGGGGFTNIGGICVVDGNFFWEKSWLDMSLFQRSDRSQMKSKVILHVFEFFHSRVWEKISVLTYNAIASITPKYICYANL